MKFGIYYLRKDRAGGTIPNPYARRLKTSHAAGAKSSIDRSPGLTLQPTPESLRAVGGVIARWVATLLIQNSSWPRRSYPDGKSWFGVIVKRIREWTVCGEKRLSLHIPWTIMMYTVAFSKRQTCGSSFRPLSGTIPAYDLMYLHPRCQGSAVRLIRTRL